MGAVVGIVVTFVVVFGFVAFVSWHGSRNNDTNNVSSTHDEGSMFDSERWGRGWGGGALHGTRKKKKKRLK